jgi:hypothetical protein
MRVGDENCKLFQDLVSRCYACDQALPLEGSVYCPLGPWVKLTFNMLLCWTMQRITEISGQPPVAS